jgi:hypothetical protein
MSLIVSKTQKQPNLPTMNDPATACVQHKGLDKPSNVTFIMPKVLLCADVVRFSLDRNVPVSKELSKSSRHTCLGQST